jgi:hypothetical protein
MKGGKYLSKGSFGCVIRPAIACETLTSMQQQVIPNNMLDNYVSKIIREPDHHLENEINISNVLQKTKSSNKYFITIINTCNLSKIPNNRINIAQAIIHSKKKNNFSLTNKRNGVNKNTTCPLDLSLKPMNLIMPYGGYDLDKVIRYKKYTNPSTSLAKMVKLYIDNLQQNIKHMLLGIVIMHKNRVAHRDIKLGNILLDLDKTETKLLIRYTDFGLSELLTGDYTSKYDNIHLRGTAQFYSPELIAVKTIYIEQDTIKRGDINHVKEKFFINSNEDNIKKLTEKILADTALYNNYLAIRGELFDKINNLFNNNKILPIFFGTYDNKFNGYLQKGDIYALGATIYESLKEHIKYNDATYKIDPLLKDLLYKMLNMDPDKRYNAIQALNHPYLANKKIINH